MEIIARRRPLVSVVIDTYNYGRFIEEAIESVLDQTFPSKEIEIIVVDDGSIDDTQSRVKKYRKRIRYFYKENGGQASALNLGFQQARGEYIALLDADDYFLPEKIGQVVQEFEKHKQVVMVLHGRQIDQNGLKRVSLMNACHNVKLSRQNVRAIQKFGFWTSTVTMKRKSLGVIIPIPNELLILADMYLASLLWLGNLSYLNKPLAVYRVHSSNWFFTSDFEKIPLILKCKREALKRVREKAVSFGNFDENLFQTLIEPELIGLKEYEVYHRTFQGQTCWFELVLVELRRLKFYWSEWNLVYKVYQILKLPIFLLFSPKFIIWLKNRYARSSWLKIRKKFFPLRSYDRET